MVTTPFDMTDRHNTPHPDWCVGRPPTCNGRFHRSAEHQVPGDPVSGDGVVVSLCGRNRLFIALDFTFVDDNPVALELARDVAEMIQTQQFGRAEEEGRAVAFQDPDDPEFVTDSHGHNLTLEQARVLRRALGDLLASATCDEAPSKPMLRLVQPDES